MRQRASHNSIQHPTTESNIPRLIARFPGARLKKQKGRQSPFWTVCVPDPSKRCPAASNWTGFSYSRLCAPFWTVCGPDPPKRCPAGSNWIGFSYSRLWAPFWTTCGPDPPKRLPAASNWIGFSYLTPPGSFLDRLRPVSFKKVSGSLELDRFTPLGTSFKLQRLGSCKMGSAGFQRDLRSVYRAAGLFDRFKVSRWLHLFAPSRVAAPVGTAASSMLGHPVHWLAPFFSFKRNLLALLLVFFFLPFLFGWGSTAAKTSEFQFEQAPPRIQRL